MILIIDKTTDKIDFRKVTVIDQPENIVIKTIHDSPSCLSIEIKNREHNETNVGEFGIYASCTNKEITTLDKILLTMQEMKKEDEEYRKGSFFEDENE